MNSSIAATMALVALMTVAPSRSFADVVSLDSEPPIQMAEAAGQADPISLAESWRRDLKARDLTISEIKAILLGKSVRIGGVVSPRGELLEWTFARKSGDRYVETDFLDHLPRKYRKLNGQVIAVELLQSSDAGVVNAFGETPGTNDTVKNPQFNVVVKFGNGKVGLARADASYFAMTDTFTVTDDRKAFAERIAKPVADLVGREIYALAFSKVYSIDTTIEELRDGSAVLKSLIGGTTLPLLKPLRVAGARYLADDDVVILKLVLPDGTEALGYSDNIAGNFAVVFDGYSIDEALTEGFALQIPPEFTPQEIEAIQNGYIFRGMSLGALKCEVGLPNSENDWGSGGKQLIYGENSYVYVDTDGKVTDWQFLK